MYTGTYDLAAAEPNNKDRQRTAADETAWYEDQLKKASPTADYIIAVGHHNIMSSGEHVRATSSRVFCAGCCGRRRTENSY